MDWQARPLKAVGVRWVHEAFVSARRLSIAVETYDARARAILFCSIPASISMSLIATVPGVSQPSRVGVLQVLAVSLLLVVGIILIRRRVTQRGTTAFAVFADLIFVALAHSLQDPVLRLVMALCLLAPPLLASMFAPIWVAWCHATASAVIGTVLVELLAGPSPHRFLRVACVGLLLVSPTAILLILRNQLNVALRRAELLATTDPLTGLLNRRGLLAQTMAVNRRAVHRNHVIGVLVADVDHFKKINDRFGHAVGDAVLVLVANQIRSTCRAEDLVVRLGGEEIAVVAVLGAAHETRHLAERLRRAVGDLDSRGERAGPAAGLPAVTVSIGALAATPIDGAPGDSWLESLLDTADSHMYRAKDAGRDRVVMGS